MDTDATANDAVGRSATLSPKRRVVPTIETGPGVTGHISIAGQTITKTDVAANGPNTTIIAVTAVRSSRALIGTADIGDTKVMDITYGVSIKRAIGSMLGVLAILSMPVTTTSKMVMSRTVMAMNSGITDKLEGIGYTVSSPLVVIMVPFIGNDTTMGAELAASVKGIDFYVNDGQMFLLY